MKKLSLKQTQVIHGEFRYEVAQVVDAVNPKIGEYLSEADAARYCKNDRWIVTINVDKK